MQTAFITGISEGIGAALALHYASQDVRVLGVSRRPFPAALADALAAEDYARIDLCASDAALKVRAFLDDRRVYGLDVLVHNAAVGWYGPLSDQCAESIDQLLYLNLYAPVSLTHALLPRLRAARGVIAFVSSVHSALPTPDFAVYTATKAGLDGFARSLRVEERGRVDVLVVWPGPTRTRMHLKSGVPSQRIRSDRYASPEVVAAAIATAIRRRRSHVIGFNNRLLRWAALHFEALIQRAMIALAKRRSMHRTEEA
ncbi:MAG: SDR family NAD(P)-dependent oxidoreductase [Caldilinea sp.]|nr:SDR family NAD(P)-dependent oxidoreductase [Caldilinea sp.]MDW8442435.1 SDR family NAD(P)-dependent oxidoreductase [Caldilineaceae bacterium]